MILDQVVFLELDIVMIEWKSIELNNMRLIRYRLENRVCLDSKVDCSRGIIRHGLHFTSATHPIMPFFF